VSTQERWDVVLKALDGPLAGMGEQVFRGPVVRVGANPGPGGFALTGYRGLDARHAVITAYDKGTASIAPVGGAQIRMAPHPHVEWKEIDPMSGPQFLSDGCALHLGPVGRGVTLEFVQCRKLGVWQTGNLASEVASAAVAGDAALGKRKGIPLAVGGAGAPPAAYDAKKARAIQASGVPVWFVGCLFLMAMAATSMIVVLVMVQTTKVKPLGPVEDGEERYDFADLSALQANPKLLAGLEGGYQEFVARPNASASGKKKHEDKSMWDEAFWEYTAASVAAHVKAWAVFKRLDAIRAEYGKVTQLMREARLPEVFAAIPYQESRYKPTNTSSVCAEGYWQFMPEVAFRIDKTTPMNFVVRDCEIVKNATKIVWSPEQMAPPPNVLKNGPYMEGEKCKITSCRVDDRKDLEKSTQAAIYALKEVWEDSEIAASGAAVQITITSHNAGFDDSRFGAAKKSNLRPAYRRWKKDVAEDDWPKFVGDQIKTPNPHEKAWGGGEYPPEAQHYAYTIVAQHLIAVCYYGLNYPDRPEFKNWQQYARGGGYCSALGVPTAQEVQARK
jgi:hypothetical protein